MKKILSSLVMFSMVASTVIGALPAVAQVVAPFPPPALEECNATSSPLTIVSNSETRKDPPSTPSVAVSPINPGWTASASIPGATWIWGENLSDADAVTGTTENFSRTFMINGTPTGGTLDIAADNTYSVSLNGNPINTDNNPDNFSSADNFVIPAGSFIAGVNTISFTVNNIGEADSTALTNPAGLLYKLDVNCTAAPTTATLTLIKTITNDNGGTAVATSWTLSATGSSGISGITGSVAVTNATVLPGGYTLSETGGPTGYTPGTWSCVTNGGTPVLGNAPSLAAGDTITCTINNDDNAPASTVLVSNLQPDYVSVGGGGVYSGYFSGSSHTPVSPGSTQVYDGREAGIIKAGQGVDPGAADWDEGLFGFKPTVTINTLAAGALTYDVETQFGVNPVWMTIEIDTGIVGDRSDNTVYQFVPPTNPAGWHTVDAGAGQWQKWTTPTSGITTGSPMTLGAVATANTGLNVVRTYLRLGMGSSYYNGGTGTTAWVDKTTIGGVTYDFVVLAEPATTATINATKIVCPAESDLPNWGNYGPDVTSSTATDFLTAHKDCHTEPWTFEYAPNGTGNPGDQAGVAGAPWTPFTSSWTTCAPENGTCTFSGTQEVRYGASGLYNYQIATGSIGCDNGTFGDPIVGTVKTCEYSTPASVTVPASDLTWVREQFQDGYIPFSGALSNLNDTASKNSAELYCNQDVLNYDNYDFVSPTAAGQTYNCVGFNVLKETPPATCDAEVNLLQNPSFENPTVTNGALWDIFPSGTPTLAWLASWINPSGAPTIANVELQKNGIAAGWAASAGTQWTELDSDWDGPSGSISGEAGSVAISQNIPTINGDNYNVAFDFSARPDTVATENVVEVLANNVVIGTVGPTAGASGTVWTTHTFNFTATGASTSITFRDAGTPSDSLGTFIDNTSVKCVTIGTLTVTKIVNNGNSGNNYTASHFPLFVDVSTSITSGVAAVLSAGSHTVSETTDPNYVGVFTGNCDSSGVVNVSVGGSASCTLTNTYTPPNTEPTTGKIQITKYECPAGTEISRGANGPSATDINSSTYTIPTGCVPEKDAKLGYTYDASNSTNNTGPYLGLFGDPTPFTPFNLTGISGITTLDPAATPGRYIVAELNGAGNQLPAEDMLGLYCYGDGDISTTDDNQEITFSVAGKVSNCVAYNKMAQITVIKNTDNESHNGTFHFNGINTDGFDITTTSGEGDATFNAYVDGTGKTLNLTEDVLAGWDFNSASCTYDGGSIGSTIPASGSIAGGDSITLYPGSDVTCTFNNTQNNPPPQTVQVHIFKYIDGAQATAGNANSDSFPMLTTFNSPNLGSVTDAPFTLSPTGWGPTDSAYEASFVGSNAPADYATHEVTGGSVVASSCTENSGQPFALVGYTTGDTLSQAQGGTPSTNIPNFTNLTSDKFVIVWNHLCASQGSGGHTGTLIVKKVIVGNENAVASDFSFTVNGGSPTQFISNGSHTGENDMVVSTGTYNVAEVANSDYTPAYDGDCSGVVINSGETKTCTVTNTLKSDVCPNIPGIQTEVPNGKHINSNGDCVNNGGGGGGGGVSGSIPIGRVLGASTTNDNFGEGGGLEGTPDVLGAAIGLPKTDGGNVPMNILILALSGLIAILGRAYLARKSRIA